MSDIQVKKSQLILPADSYTGTNVAYVSASSDTLGSVQVDHPEVGQLQFAVSNDTTQKDFADKTWIPIQVRPQGGTLTSAIDLTTVGADPVGVAFKCQPFAFLRMTLTGAAGGDYRAIYNVPFKNRENS